MTKLSGFFDPRDAQGFPPRLQYVNGLGTYAFVAAAPDANSGKYVAKYTPVPPGKKLVLDFGGIERGWLCFRPFDDQYLVPFPQPIPTQPEGDYTRAIRFPVLVEGFGLAQWTAAGTLVQNSLFGVYTAFERSAEATLGEIPIVVIRPSRQISIASRSGEVHTVPVLEIIGWTERKVDVFGPRKVPPPSPILAHETPPPRVEQTGDGMTAVNDNNPATSPANDNAFDMATPITRSSPAATVNANFPPF